MKDLKKKSGPTFSKNAGASIEGLKSPAGVRLVEIPPELWHALALPDYQRKQNPAKVKDIARGLREGYRPAPILLYVREGGLAVVDGGHRVAAPRLNREQHNFTRDIPALLYEAEAMDQHLSFALENNKLRMSPTALIQADRRRAVSALLRALKDGVFSPAESIYDYPVGPLTVVKAALLLYRPDAAQAVNRLAYLSVARALEEADRALEEDPSFWGFVVLPFLSSIGELWGFKGRQCLNFGVIGFAYFLSRNRAYFYDDGLLEIQKERSRNSGKRGTRETRDRSDFVKLAALGEKWNKWGSTLYEEAPRDPIRVAREINEHFWRNRPRAGRAWQPEPTTLAEVREVQP
jgi:hypothetical protein